MGDWSLTCFGLEGKQKHLNNVPYTKRHYISYEQKPGYHIIKYRQI